VTERRCCRRTNNTFTLLRVRTRVQYHGTLLRVRTRVQYHGRSDFTRHAIYNTSQIPVKTAPNKGNVIRFHSLNSRAFFFYAFVVDVINDTIFASADIGRQRVVLQRVLQRVLFPCRNHMGHCPGETGSLLWLSFSLRSGPETDFVAIVLKPVENMSI